MKGRQKVLFPFLLFLVFFQLNISWKFELTTFPFSLSKFQAFFAIIFKFRENGNETCFSLCQHDLNS